jgi:cobaltochelatase CobN
MADRALLLACAGCCCGHPESGGPKTPPRALKGALRRLFRRAGLDGRARLAFTDCLGPCSEANVLFLYLDGRPLWLRRMNTPALGEALLAWLAAALAADEPPALPPALAARAFAWTGGGPGPRPPVGD